MAALLVFGAAMLLHTLFLLVLEVSMPNKLPQLLMVLSATLIYDSTFIIDLIRNNIPVAYSPLDIIVLGMVPWLIAGIIGERSLKSTWDAIKGATTGVILGDFVFFYLWVGIGGFSFVGLFLSLQVYVGSVLNMLFASIGAACGTKLRNWVQKLPKSGSR